MLTSGSILVQSWPNPGPILVQPDQPEPVPILARQIHRGPTVIAAATRAIGQIVLFREQALSF
jgi:hypothetical protein